MRTHNVARAGCRSTTVSHQYTLVADGGPIISRFGSTAVVRTEDDLPATAAEVSSLGPGAVWGRGRP
jgi:hypothetical protein